MRSTDRSVGFIAGAAAMLVSGVTLAQAFVPGFVANATYWEGQPPRIQVSISHSLTEDRVSDVELVLPEGGAISAQRLNRETVSESRTVTSDSYGGGPSVGLGFGFGTGGWSGGHVGTGIGFGFPFGGGGMTTTETVTKEVRTNVEIAIPDPRDYQINWSFYKIRVSVARANGSTDVAIIGPPRP